MVITGGINDRGKAPVPHIESFRSQCHLLRSLLYGVIYPHAHIVHGFIVGAPGKTLQSDDDRMPVWPRAPISDREVRLNTYRTGNEGGATAGRGK